MLLRHSPENMIDPTHRCQSCGMPLDKGFYATNADGTISSEYCRFCFSLGVFTDPKMTVEQMTAKTVSHGTRVLQMTLAAATERARELIPHLKRWKHPAA